MCDFQQQTQLLLHASTIAWIKFGLIALLTESIAVAGSTETANPTVFAENRDEFLTLGITIGNNNVYGQPKNQYAPQQDQQEISDHVVQQDYEYARDESHKYLQQKGAMNVEGDETNEIPSFPNHPYPSTQLHTEITDPNKRSSMFDPFRSFGRNKQIVLQRIATAKFNQPNGTHSPKFGQNILPTINLNNLQNYNFVVQKSRIERRSSLFDPFRRRHDETFKIATPVTAVPGQINSKCFLPINLARQITNPGQVSKTEVRNLFKEYLRRMILARKQCPVIYIRKEE